VLPRPTAEAGAEVTVVVVGAEVSAAEAGEEVYTAKVFAAGALLTVADFAVMDSGLMATSVAIIPATMDMELAT